MYEIRHTEQYEGTSLYSYDTEEEMLDAFFKFIESGWKPEDMSVVIIARELDNDELMSNQEKYTVQMKLREVEAQIKQAEKNRQFLLDQIKSLNAQQEPRK